MKPKNPIKSKKPGGFGLFKKAGFSEPVQERQLGRKNLLQGPQEPGVPWSNCGWVDRLSN